MVDCITDWEFWYAKTFDGFPYFIDSRPAYDFLHFAKQFVCVVEPGDVPDTGDKIARHDGVQVDGADSRHFLGKQKEEEAQIVFDVEALATPEPCTQAILMEGLCSEGRGVFAPAADEGHIMARGGE